MAKATEPAEKPAGGDAPVRPESTPASDKQPVSVWQRKHYPVKKGPVPLMNRPHERLYEHAAAAALHNWGPYVHHHGGKEFELTEADYLKAVEAAKEPRGSVETQTRASRKTKGPKVATYEPHPPAFFDLAAATKGADR